MKGTAASLPALNKNWNREPSTSPYSEAVRTMCSVIVEGYIYRRASLGVPKKHVSCNG